MKGTDLRPEILRPFDARHVPLAPPAADLCDAPTVTICVNSSWWSHLEGQISRLLYRDAWLGTDDEIERAISQIEEVLSVGKADPMGCCCNGNQVVLTRFNPDTGRLEQSTDGGATWTNAPDARFDGAVSPNPYTGTEDQIKCLAAANVAAVAEEHADQFIADGGMWAGITSAIPVIMAVLVWIGVVASFGTLTPLALALTGALIHAGSSGFAAAMTGDVYNTFACIVYCHIQSDGTFTIADINAIKADILDQLNSPPSIAAKYLADLVGLWGPVGMGNAAHSGRTDDASCVDCDCPVGLVTLDGVPADAGTIVEISPNVWQLTTTFRPMAPPAVTDSYTVYVQKSDASCWKIVSTTLISGSFVGGTSGSNCPGLQYVLFGDPTQHLDVPESVTAIDGQNLLWAGWRSEAPFTIEIEIEEC